MHMDCLCNLCIICNRRKKKDMLINYMPEKNIVNARNSRTYNSMQYRLLFFLLFFGIGTMVGIHKFNKYILIYIGVHPLIISHTKLLFHISYLFTTKFKAVFFSRIIAFLCVRSTPNIQIHTYDQMKIYIYIYI